jgi:hypothetical protein
MVLALVLLAIAAYALRDGMRLQEGRRQFDEAWAGWQTSRATAENVILTSSALAEVETASPWISREAARRGHLIRLNRLLQDILSPAPDADPRWTERQAEIVRREISELSTLRDSE